MYTCEHCQRTFLSAKGLSTHKYRCNHRPGARCRKCNELLTDENRIKSSRRTNRNVCIHCHRKYMCNYRREHIEAFKAYQQKTELTMSAERKLRRKRRRQLSSRRYFEKLRDELIEAYGGCCECCKETNKEFLSIDHIYSDGRHEQKILGIHGGRVLYWNLRKRGFPKDRYRLLCYNCNLSIGHYGYCPHQKQLELFASMPHRKSART